MSELFLIRHGQASYGSDEYDRLSALGRKQAQWLGAYFRARAITPDHIITGTQSRHRETLEAMIARWGIRPAIELDERWNEIDFQELVEGFSRQHPEIGHYSADQPKSFFKVMRRALLAWSEDEIEGALREDWSQLQARVSGALRDIQSRCGKVLVISSSGAIATALMHIMRFPAQTHADLYVQARNTGFSECFFNAEVMRVTAINQTPHLDMPERQDSLTFI